MLLFVPNMWTEQGKKAFIYSALTVWNTLQKDLGLVEFILLNAFKLKMKEIELDSLRYQCFCFLVKEKDILRSMQCELICLILVLFKFLSLCVCLKLFVCNCAA